MIRLTEAGRRTGSVMTSRQARLIALDERILINRALFSSMPTESKDDAAPSQKSKEEIATKLKQALLDSSKQPKKKPAVSPTAVPTHSSGPSTPFSAPTAATSSPSSSAASGAESSPGSTAKSNAATAGETSESSASAESLRRESTFERLGERLKRAFTDAKNESRDWGLAPPPNSVKVDPHIVTRSQVTPARNVLNLTKNVTMAALRSTLLLPPMIWRALVWMGKGLIRVAKEPSVISSGSAKMWKSIKHEAHHYWTGFKILGLELKTSSALLTSKLQGKDLTRRESQQLRRTFTDVLRMGPFLVFVIVPFMEFTLPIFLKLFPNMLPSTFIDEKQKQMTRKNIGQLRKEMASFMQEMVAEMENKVRDKGADAKTLKSLVEFVECSRNNLPIRPELIPVLTKTFSDELTIERMTREQLQMMCRFMGVSTIGSDDFLRYSLLSRLRGVRADDVQISWEGVESLTLEELKLAALERGMQAESDDIQYYRRLLARWIELSVTHNVSPAMLILSRAFAVAGPAQRPSTDPQESVKQVLSSIEPDIVQEALVSAVDEVTSKVDAELDRTTLQKAKLESIKRENELIEEEEEEKKDAKPLVNALGPGEPIKGLSGKEALGNSSPNAASLKSPKTSSSDSHEAKL